METLPGGPPAPGTHGAEAGTAGEEIGVTEGTRTPDLQGHNLAL